VKQSVSIKSVAVIMSVYRNDTPEKFLRAFRSIINQRLSTSIGINMYLGIDGPISAELQQAIDTVRQEIKLLAPFPHNRGVAPVVNDIIPQLADEPFVFRMDADDEAYPDRFQRQLDFMLANSDVDVLGTALMERRADGPERIVRFPESNDEAVANLYWRVAIANPTVCFRRKVLDETGGYPVENLSEDLAMWFKCAKHGYRFANLQEPLLYFTLDENFWARRSIERAWREYLVWSKGIWELHGLSWRLSVPLVRLAFRISPKFLRRAAYGSALRRTESL
jgi:glycosyltransferase involved in cell wall biosynthesis